MAGRKGGTAPLGDAWDSKVKIEGPKKHHDGHGIHASVPGKHPVPCEHWEHHYSLCEPSPNMYATAGADFAAKESDKRKTTQLKVNKTDH